MFSEVGGDLAVTDAQVIALLESVISYDSDSSISDDTAVKVAGRFFNGVGYNVEILATDVEGRLILSPTGGGPPTDATIVAPLDGAGNVLVDVADIGTVDVDVISSIELEVYIDGTKGSLPAFAATPTVILDAVVALVGDPLPAAGVLIGGNAGGAFQPWAVLPGGALGYELPVAIDGTLGSLPPFAATPTVDVGTMPAVVVTSITDPIVVTSITDAVSVDIASPLDGGGNVKVNVEAATLGTVDVDVTSAVELEVYIDGTKGSLPAFAAEPTVIIDGTAGSLPAFHATPTVNVGTMPAVVVTSITDPIVVTSITDAVSVDIASPLDGGGNVKVNVEAATLGTVDVDVTSAVELEVYIDGTKGSLPAFAAEPTVIIDGTAGSLPAFHATPTVNLGQVVGTVAGPGAEPANGVLVGGSDGVSFLPIPVGIPGSAVPGRGVQVGGTDGTDFRVIPVVDAGTGYPAQVVVIGGVDGTDARALRTDATGHQQVVTPAAGLVNSLHAGGGSVASVSYTAADEESNVLLLAAPAAGQAYVLHSWSITTAIANIAAITAMRLTDTTRSEGLAMLSYAISGQGFQALHGLISTGAISVNSMANNADTIEVTLNYDTVTLPVPV